MIEAQKELIKKHQYACIKFMPKKEMPAPAFCKKGKVHYEVFLSKEDRDDKSKKRFLRTLLLHELGHLDSEHLNIDYDEEFEKIKEAKERYEKANNISDEDKRIFDVSLVLNIAGDLEVNSKYLTFGDIKHLTEQGFTPITLKAFKTTYKEKFYEYYDDIVAELYRRPALPVVVMDMEASASLGKKGGKSEGKGKGSSKNDETESDTVTGVMRSSSDDFDKEMSDNPEDEESKDKSGENDKDSKSKSNGQGSGDSKVFIARNKKETEEELTKLLLSIKDVKRTRQLDQLRLYNRGTRRNSSGVLYTSVKRKVHKSTEKLGVLIDVSGSMNISSIMKSLETISRVAPNLHRDTKVKCWQESKTDEFYVSKIPDKIRSGGGTYLPAGLKEFLDEGYDNIVVYSDFCDTLSDYIEVFDEHPCKLYLVSTVNEDYHGYGRDDYWQKLKDRAIRVIHTSENN